MLLLLATLVQLASNELLHLCSTPSYKVSICSGEHSVGWGKKEYLKKELGPETLDAMRAIKYSLDPLWIMNPGKIIDIPSRRVG